MMWLKCALVAVVTSTLVACTAPAVQVTESGYSVIVGPRSGTQLMARIDGELALTDGDCIGIEVSPGETYVLIFPPESAVTSGDRITLPGGDVVGIGDRVQGGGGEVQADLVGVSVPEACASESYLVSNSLSPAE
jgi:hypothetical protein